MKIIIFEDRVFKVTEKEFDILWDKQKDISSYAHNNKLFCQKENELAEYLDNNQHRYTFLGTTDFHFQR